MTKDEARVIAAAFDSCLKTGDQSLIKGFTKVQINMALSALPHLDREKLWYKKMERRIAELDTIETKKEERKEVSKNRWFNFILNTVAGKIVGILIALLIGGAGGYLIKTNNIKVASDNPTIMVSFDNRQFVNVSVASLTVAPGGNAILTATAQDAATGDTIKFAVDGKLDFLTDSDGNVITDSDGEPIIVETGKLPGKK